MIKITVELISAIDGHREILGVGTIANDVRKTVQTSGVFGDYNVKLTTRGGKRHWRDGRVIGFPRKRLTAWDLVSRALQACLADRNPVDPPASIK